jgi:hypothetical protein
MNGPAYDNAIRAWETARAEMVSSAVQAKDTQYVPPITFLDIANVWSDTRFALHPFLCSQLTSTPSQRMPPRAREWEVDTV